MKVEIKLTVIWEEITSPDAEQRLATAFSMLFSPMQPHDLTDNGLDSQK
jgi:hypothetical protein